MRILAIETSCDDTGIAILDVRDNGSFNVLANIIASQVQIHKKYGGVYPVMAKREHQKNLIPTFERALKEAKLLKKSTAANLSPDKITTTKKILERESELYKKLISFFKKYTEPEAGGPDEGGIDAVAVTNGPGLEPCLWVGVNFAKALAYFWNLPVIEVNHIKAHIFVNALDNGEKIQGLAQKDFPALCLVVSGGHTQLFLMRDFGKYEIVGETRDDAAGECFDKCAKILGLGYPGGPIIAKLASELRGDRASTKLPRPMISTKDYDFSFSGLKTAVLYADRKVKDKNIKYKKQMAAEIQQAIIDVLIKKTIKAAKDFGAKTIMLGGGVTANKELRKQLIKKIDKELPDTSILIPPPTLSTDNGLMVAVTGYFNAKQNKFTKWQDIEAKANLRVK